MDQSSRSTSVASLDIATLKATLEAVGDEQGEVLAILLETFQGHTPEMLQAMVTAVRGRDTKMLRRGAHTLKSSSATLGALQLSHLCEVIEQSNLEEQFEATQILVTQAQHEYEHVNQALGTYLRALQNSSNAL
ncbi:MAG: Hpt domain-containing protein [Cyanobacteria bacterium P01_H01_bin.121]